MFEKARSILDEVQHLSQLERFDPARFTAALETAPAAGGMAELEGHLEAVRGLLGEIDRFAQKAMRIRVTHVADTLPQQLRTLLHTTIVQYENDLPLFRQRMGQAMARLDPRVADPVFEAAREVLATRELLRRGVLALAQRVAEAWQPLADRAARDRSQPDDQRDRWKRARVDLRQLAENGAVLGSGSFDKRVSRVTGEEPPDEERPDRFSLLELD